MNTLDRFEERQAEISPAIVATLRELGDGSLEAYDSIDLYHNTLSHFTPTIMLEGLIPGGGGGIPEQKVLDFAKELFRNKGDFREGRDLAFKKYILGDLGDGQPGIFFYPVNEFTRHNGSFFNTGYGIPERMNILALEMGYVALMDDGPYTYAEKNHAESIHEKYRDLILGNSDSHIAVLKANPFSPVIINHRLARLPAVRKKLTQEAAIEQLKILDSYKWDGVRIPQTIPPEDLELVDVRLPIETGLATPLREAKIDPSHSRFYYKPLTSTK